MKKLFNVIKTKLISFFNLPELEHFFENKTDIESKHNNNLLINQTIKKFKKYGGIFNGFALTEASVRSFFYNLFLNDKEEYLIVEFGGGQSTLFLNELLKIKRLKIVTYEHDMEWVDFLLNRVKPNKNLNIFHCPLGQIKDCDKEDMFISPMKARDIWEENLIDVPKEDYKNTRIRNCFYKIEDEKMPNSSFDGVIIDGPHGNGRSLMFPLFYNLFRSNNTIVLIDDYHHYPFLDDLSRLFDYEICEKRNYKFSNKGWVVLRITTIKVI
jgi:hypothetical protein